MNVCPSCGAEYTFGVNAACRDCRLAPDPTRQPTLPDDDTGPDEIAFDMAAWPAADRVSLGVTLDAEGVPWRWEPGLLLVVREIDEAGAEQILEKSEGDAPVWDDVEGEGDEQGQDAMGNLFLAGDRLIHAPWNGELIAEVGRLAGIVGESTPPFGMETDVWEGIAGLAADVVEAGEEGDEAGVEETARTLRDFLRQYI